MRKALWINAALLAAVVALGWFVHVTRRDQGPVEYSLSALKPGAVKHVRIERRAQPPVMLERKGDHWFLTTPFAARAEAFNVWRLLAILDAKPSSRLATTDLSRFDLNQPTSRLTIDGQTFSFGTVNAVAREQYIMTDDTVYTVPPRYGAAVPSDFTQLIERRLFASDEAPVAIELEKFGVQMSGGKWIVVPGTRDGKRPEGSAAGRCEAESATSAAPPGCRISSLPAGRASLSATLSGLSQDDINRWVDDWRRASALRAVPFVNGTPVGTIAIALKNEKKLTLAILQREPELVLLRRDENLLYYFVAETAKRLLQPPGSKR